MLYGSRRVDLSCQKYVVELFWTVVQGAGDGGYSSKSLIRFL
jgi:hypothetical protein